MLIEQAIKFESSGHGSPGRINALLQLVVFMTKQKSRRGIFAKQCTLLSTTRAKKLTKFKPKIPDFKRVLDLICK